MVFSEARGSWLVADGELEPTTKTKAQGAAGNAESFVPDKDFLDACRYIEKRGRSRIASETFARMLAEYDESGHITLDESAGAQMYRVIADALWVSSLSDFKRSGK